MLQFLSLPFAIPRQHSRRLGEGLYNSCPSPDIFWLADREDLRRDFRPYSFPGADGMILNEPKRATTFSTPPTVRPTRMLRSHGGSLSPGWVSPTGVQIFPSALDAKWNRRPC